jgi:hypothetical protein
MPALEYFLVAESVSVDQTTNHVSVFDVLEEVRLTSAPPSAMQQIAVICAWNVPPEDLGRDFQAIFRVHFPGLPDKDFAMNFIGTHPRQRLVARLLNFALPTLGEYVFEVLLNGQHQAPSG